MKKLSNKIKHPLLLVILLLFINFKLSAQVISKDLSVSEKLYANTIIDAYKYLKKQPTPIKRIDSVKKEVDDFYDDVINKFYSVERMKIEFGKDESHFAVEGKIDIQRLMLNTCDLWLDKLPDDSIHILHLASVSNYSNDKIENEKKSLSIAFGKTKIPFLHIWFDELTKKIIGIMTLNLSEADRKYLLSYSKTPL
jgi:hypothetical protein